MRCFLALAILLAGLPAAAQDYPNKPVRMIVPFPAGGTTDVLARALGKELSERWGQPVVIDNRGGASGNLGTEATARAAPDGYTLELGSTSTHATNISLYSGLTWDPVRDFQAVALVATVPHALVVHPGLPVRSVADLVALAKKEPGKLNFASSSNGSPSHLIGELFKLKTGIDTVHVPYRGITPSVNDLVAGQVQFMFATLSGVIGQIEAGTLRALALASDRRAPALPNLPTTGEAGFDGMAADAWLGLFGPAGLPRPITDRVHADVDAILARPDMREKLSQMGFAARTDTVDGFTAFVKTEVTRWEVVIKAAGAKLD